MWLTTVAHQIANGSVDRFHMTAVYLTSGTQLIVEMQPLGAQRGAFEVVCSVSFYSFTRFPDCAALLGLLTSKNRIVALKHNQVYS